MPISIAGMHRSGTSMVTRILNAAGLYLGPHSDLMPPRAENPEGYWENARFVALNDGILEALGGAWDLPPAFPPRWAEFASVPELLERARALVREFEGREPWGWKDPRNSLTLPFWRSVIPGFGVVVCLRHPMEVARSLVARNPSGSLRLGFSLWEKYNQRILETTSPDDRLITRYETYFSDFDREVSRLLSFARIPLSAAVLAACRSVPVPALRHNMSNAESDSIPDSVRDLYEQMLAETELRIPGETPDRGVERRPDQLALDAARNEIRSLRAALRGRDTRLAEAEENAALLRRTTAESEARHESLVARFTEHAAQQQRQLAGLAESLQKLTTRTGRIEAEISGTYVKVQSLVAEVGSEVQALRSEFTAFARRPSVGARIRDLLLSLPHLVDALVQRVYTPVLTPIVQLQTSSRAAYRWQSTGDDPQLRVEPPLPWGWVEMQIRGRADPPAVVKVYFDKGVGMSEGTVFRPGVLLPDRMTELVAVVNLQHCRALRLDPSLAPGFITIESFTLKRLGTVGVVARALAAYRARASGREMGWRDIAGKALAHLRRGGIRALRQAVAQQIATSPETGRDDAAAEYDIERQVRSALREGRSSLPSEIPPIVLAPAENPTISIVIPVWNRAELTYRCLESLVPTFDEVPCELIIVDNGSSDRTQELLERTTNVHVIRNQANMGFVRACNQGAEKARGEYLLFLNNDTHVLNGSVARLLETIQSDSNIGAVGGRLILMDGRLQEAGSIVWADGSCLGYGRGGLPFAPEYCFARDVHYCSAALLLTRRQLFVDLGMFDRRYEPSYYEDVDYCMAVHVAGYRVMYQPLGTIVHREFGSSDRAQSAIDLQLKNQRVFVSKWSKSLSTFLPPDPKNVLAARDFNARKQRALFIDDRIPDPALGSGYPRSYTLVTSLVAAGYGVTIFPLQFPEATEPIRTDLQQKGVEVLYGSANGPLNLSRHLEERPGYYDIILVSRPHNMRQVRSVLDRLEPRPKVIYDAEAIYAERDLALARLTGTVVDAVAARRLVAEEVALTKGADCVLAVSDRDREIFTKHGAENVHTVGFSVDPHQIASVQEPRADLLFVGAILRSPSPNEDALLHFIDEIFPLILKDLDCRLLIVGTNESRAIRAHASERVVVTGRVDELGSFYARAKVFVVPTRYAAGLPFKLYEASGYGVPSVVTPLIAAQVGWRDAGELLVGADPEDFARKVVSLYTDNDLWCRIGLAAAKAVARDCSREKFAADLNGAVNSLHDGDRVMAPLRRASTTSV